MSDKPLLKKADFQSDQAIRWCPGCGDYAILAQTQKTFPEITEKKENTVFISGIGCSSRFPYYMNTFGFHTIHGRAPTIASGLKMANPELSVWLVTGDGDGFSIGGNHMIHLLRRNVDINVMLFNNRIYGLTKGQYSPTSEQGKVTYSTPMGSIDYPFKPTKLALGAEASFVAKTIDKELKHLQAMIKRANSHKGTSFIEIYQNCNIFNDGAFSHLTDRDSKEEQLLRLEDGEPMIFGAEKDKGIYLDGTSPKVVQIGKDYSIDDIVVHNEKDRFIGDMLANFTASEEFPEPIGVLYCKERPSYDELMEAQMNEAQKDSKKAKGLYELLNAGDTWEVK
ncbi:2-oxoacid:ferredoxin oxidoreductase subunit beta [Candidatus Marinimicrobia bacterium]|jgi:2-oxoglutarate ferredoxin oxidoreductase subunit beta|nr:2-oxoacid:ferredoxin oxidoreductase subunit beta [Candidatus Neomarinimicrobiota bacterium]MDA9841346.1 2-oxoacid:ferredoxin oxidoreductase subunit beta [Candidatus Neomarinimicrobiota bacterium]MDB3979865.1 2-oxoacid:ferredoxin oxidoreductase subunit beta [Candidatus Neomarinimicrobiota bacterium]MDC0878192.1 2-oxoacid:ferredoxin oxidoreductase subunit beta [Candidatus Neomarinimicrobiota bacterium]MDC1000744.1 2-oxoacid:ferredoxin oxidoreductase subunit beta [Candidatus Neomarinimicrobiota|tara:strand:+ start:11419 stop:12432 length:1014 start_codon:yes stop_codon:yes gene_type:complete